MARYTTRPLSDLAWLRPASRRTATRFKASWSDTVDLLSREVDMLNGRNLVIEVDVNPADIRLDGEIRARAIATSPAVIVAFESKHGPLMYRADALDAPYYDQGPGWQHNVRAVALTLEALRAVDRYGAAGSGEQYAGWAQIAAAPHGPSSVADAWVWLQGLAGTPDGSAPELVVSRARRASHPDSGGSSELWHQFTAAYDMVRGI